MNALLSNKIVMTTQSTAFQSKSGVGEFNRKIVLLPGVKDQAWPETVRSMQSRATRVIVVAFISALILSN